MERSFLVVFLVMMLASGLTACSAGEADVQTPAPAASPSASTPASPSTFVPTRPDKPVQKPEPVQIIEYIPVGGTVKAPKPVERPWQSEQPFEPEDLEDYFVVDPEKKQIGGELEVEHFCVFSELYPSSVII